MKTIKHVAVVAALLAAPLAAFAQAEMAPTETPQDSLTRAQVKQDQIQVQQAGYNNSAGDQASYPREAQAAEARVGAMQTRDGASGYGGVAAGSSASGSPVPMSVQPAHTGVPPGTKPVYFGN
ncbi:DUF4148 domain-containing protein [Paraburkholderia sp. J76]|uniref:DUF4148 domain-containing protein n=1 Tax=Paraburkholderia sp. J76 TaxID=2805439 RepID=UPI002ABD9A4C|nr:DUF4148 domain-containing protein [Paraburkholderia sp. J76]